MRTWGRRVMLLAALALAAVFATRGGDDDARPLTQPIATTTIASMPVKATAAPTRTPARRATSTVASATATITSTTLRTPTPTVTATPVGFALESFVGVYDASPDSDTGGRASEWIATVSGTSDEMTVTIFFDGQSQLELRGALRADGTADLAGRGTTDDNVVFLGEGNATFLELDDVQQIRGEFDDKTILGLSTTFRLERPIERTLRRFAGNYDFTFTPSPGGCNCTTTAIMEIRIDRDGFAESPVAAAEFDERGTRQGTFEAGPCLVTASGRLRCMLPYGSALVQQPGRTSDGAAFPITLTGQLTGRRRIVKGSGVSMPSAPVPSFLGGSWTATR